MRVLINNGYSNKQFHEELTKFKSMINNAEEVQTANSIPIFYKNQMSSAYKIDERVLKTILARNIATNSSDTKLNLFIYYKNKKATNLILKNKLQDQGTLKWMLFIQETNMYSEMMIPHAYMMIPHAYMMIPHAYMMIPHASCHI